MNLADLFGRTEKLVIDNSPALLTAIGVVGTVTTAILTGKATYNYMELLAEEGYYDDDRRFDRTPKEHVEEAWKFYIPPMGSGLLTVTAIVAANRIGTRRAAGIAAAFTLSEKAYSEYKDKVRETIGERKEQAIRDDLAQDRVTRNSDSSQIIISGTKVLCYDSYTDRYFESSKADLDAAQNELNRTVINNSYASLTDLYNLLDIPKTSVSDELGWTTDNLLEMKFSSVLAPDGRPCLAVDYAVDAVRDYWRNR